MQKRPRRKPEFQSKKNPIRLQSKYNRRSEPEDERLEGEMRPARKENVLTALEEIWELLFTSPVHLDSALSKTPKHLKSLLAQLVPPILMKPASLGEALGVGMAPDEPWSLNPDKLSRWRNARLIAERLYESLPQGGVRVDAQPSDFPPFIVEELESAWGRKRALELIAALGQEAPLGLRSSRKVGAAKLIDHLNRNLKIGVRATASELSPTGVRLDGYAPVMQGELFEGGGYEIQDEGSQVMAYFALWPELFAHLLQKEPGGKAAKPGAKPAELPIDVPPITVVDACAGAGGKSLAMADALKGKGRVFAYDTSAKKLQALKRRATRAGVNNIQAVTVERGNENKVVDQFKRRAQVVLVDAPCSGWGVLRRNPDIKWRTRPESLQELPELQLRILKQYSELVAPGGRLVFGVCTFRKQETTELVQAFLKEAKDFELREGGYLGPGPTDGFFMQAFERKAKK